MAITTINDLTEVQSAGANDVLPISTENGVKKIKASAIGGGSSDIGIINVDFNGGDWRTVQTAGAIKAMVEAGKYMIGLCNIDTGIIAQFFVAATNFASAPYFMELDTYNEGSVTPVAMGASSDNDVFTVRS